MKLPNAATRQYLYTILTVAVPILIAYGVIKAEDAALWLALGGAILGTGTAAVAITRQRKDGTVE